MFKLNKTNIKPTDICKFPKHKGKSFIDVYYEDKAYLEWLLQKKLIYYDTREFNKIIESKHSSSFVDNLNREQLIISDHLLLEIRNQHSHTNYRSIAVDAESGSGKSHTLVQTIARIPIKEILECYNMYVLGPTNHAVNLLKTKINVIADDIKIMTLHKCLKMMKKYNDDGLIYFKPDGDYVSKISISNNNKSKINIFFIDEASMICDRIYNYLKAINGLFVYFGDIKQLPPIEEAMNFSIGVSKTLTDTDIKLSLTKIVRAKNDNILNIHKSFRNADNVIIENDNVKIYTNDYDFYDAFINALKIDQLSCILTYTNNRVKEHSCNIRKLLGFSNAFDKNELLRCNNYYDSVNIGSLHNLGIILIMDDQLQFDNDCAEYFNEKIIYSTANSVNNISEIASDYITFGLKKFELLPTKYSTSTIVTITSCKQIRLLFIIKSPSLSMPEKHFCIKFELIDIIDSDKLPGCITILEQSVENTELWNTLLKHWNNSLKIVFGNKIKWQLYYNILEIDAQFTHTYSMTIHKAQGSTIKNVFVDMNDINKIDDDVMKQHLLYTAVTRSSDNVNFLI